MVIKSPLGAIGAIVVLIQAVAASALFAVESRYGLQIALVAVIAAVTVAISGFIIWLVHHLVKIDPALLFDPASISKAAHPFIYVKDNHSISAVLDTKSDAQ